MKSRRAPDRPAVAIFTLTCNRLEYTRRMMDSLGGRTAVAYDHFVVDNGSTDGTVEYLKSRGDRIKGLILNQENRGISIASNQALDMIGDDYDYICKLDNDCLIKSDRWLGKIMAVAAADPQLVLSPRVEGLYTNKGGAPRYEKQTFGDLTLGFTKHLGGICVFAPRPAYQDFRFDETDTLHGTQDSDFSRHALRHGYRLAYVEDLEVEHMDGTRGQVAKYPDYFREYYETWKWRPYGRRVRPWDLALMTFRRWRDRRKLVKRFPAYLTTLTHPKRVVFLPGVTENPYLSLLARELARNELSAGFRGRLSPGWLLLNRRVYGILHLHWLEYLHGRHDGLRAVLDYAYFMAKLRLARMLGYKTVWTVHNLKPHEVHEGFAGPRCRRYVARRADAIICHSRFVKTELENTYGRTAGVHVIPHGNYIAWEAYQNNNVKTEAARRALKLPADKFIYLFFGQIRTNKGLDRLVSAIDRLDDDFRLIIAGKPMTDDTDIQMLMDHPRIYCWPRFIPDEEVHLFFAAADAAVLPFTSVTTSGSLMLAMSFGKPVVAPALPPLLEVVTDDFATTYEPEDPGALAVAMEAMRRRDLAADGRKAKQAALKSGWGAVGRDHASIYRQLRGDR